MSWFVITILMGLIGIGSLAVALFGPNDNSENFHVRRWAGIVSVLALLIWVVSSMATSAHSVDAGEVGIVRTFGNITGQRDSGLQFIWPWQSMTTVDTKTQTYATGDKDSLGQPGQAYAAFSKDSQDVFMHVTLVYHVERNAVQTLIRTAGTHYFATLAVEPLLRNIVKEETVKYSAVDIAPNREAIRTAVAERLGAALAAKSITVDQVTIDNIDFDKQFKDAIAAKAAASQNAQAEQNNVAKAQAIAQQGIETAKGAAEQRSIAADAEANANTVITKSLTPQFIQYRAITQLAPDIKIALIPSGQGLIIDPTTIFGTEGK